MSEIETRLRAGAVYRARVLGDAAALEAARVHFAAQPAVASAVLRDDGIVEIGFRGDDAAAAGLLAGAIGAGVRLVSFGRAASDLEELFLQVTAADLARPMEPAPAGDGGS
ncbi:MAG: hypothetical protein MUC54_04280 [Chloroflexi bacterium]|nr:hypothetical protein [Chloroflexota bacterium]